MGKVELPAGIEQRGQRYRVRVAYCGRRETRTFASLAPALAWRADAEDRLRRGEPVERPASLPLPTAGRVGVVTVEEAARVMGRGITAGTVRTRTGSPYKPSVSRKYESMMRVHVVPLIGAMPVSALTKRDVQRLVDELAAQESPETARKALTAFRVVLRVAERDGLISTNPCAGVRVPVDGNGERPVRVLTPGRVRPDHCGQRSPR